MIKCLQEDRKAFPIHNDGCDLELFGETYQGDKEGEDHGQQRRLEVDLCATWVLIRAAFEQIGHTFILLTSS